MTKARFIGCLVGHAIADALGAPVEGLDARLIYSQFGRAADYVAKPPVDVLHYTDDTQMTIGLAESLLRCGQVDEDDLAQTFASNYDPERGYGQGARQLMHVIRDGGDWRSFRDHMFDGGSYGNGAAMRIAPIAMRFFKDQARCRDEATRSARVTHTHPLGVEGAQLMAEAIRFALTHETVDPHELIRHLADQATTDEFQWQMRTATQLPFEDFYYQLGNGLEAHRSVGTAILCFAMSPDSYEQTIATAISRGGDTDTIAAMAGAISGACLGVEAVPDHLCDHFEKQAKGLDYIVSLAEQLWASATDERSPK